MFIADLFEASKKVAVLTYGRFNPPTIGHAKLVDKILSIPGDHFVVVSHTQDNKKNPLSSSEKISLLRKMYPGDDVFVPASKEMPTIMDAAAMLTQQGYSKLIVVLGADRVASFTDLFNKYNGVATAKGPGFKFDTIKVISAGERDPDADDTEGMSASKLRQAAMDNDVATFKSGLSPAIQGMAQQLMTLIQSRLGPVKK